MAFGRFERLVAWRYLRPTKGEGFISVIAGFALVGIALGVGTLIVVLAVMNGFRAELLGRVLGVNGHATVVSGPAGIPDFDGLVAQTAGRAGPHRRHALCRGPGDGQRQRRGFRCAGPRRATGRPGGARGDREPRHRRHAGVAGRVPATAAIGSRMAQRMGLRLGSQLTLISPKGAATALGSVPRIKTFTVGAVFEVGMYEYDNSFVYIPLADAQAYFQLPDTVNAVEIMVARSRADRQPTGARSSAAGRRAPAGRLAAAQLALLRRAPGRAQRDVPDPDPDHPGRRLQHHHRHHHAGEEQGPRHRDHALDGRHAWRDPARLLPERRLDRRRRHAARASCSASPSRSTSTRSGAGWKA